MQGDEAMLANGQPAWRVYTWQGLWVSIGRSQIPEETLANPGVPWVRRPTGGSAVLHGHDVTVALALPLGKSLGVGHTYRLVTRPLIDALVSMGIPAQLAEERESPQGYQHHPDCFATTTRNDILDPRSGEKLCGCALRRTRTGVLMQASIPISEPLVAPSEAIKGGVATRITRLDPVDLHRALALAILK
jgi:lipoate-protein ligase A